MLERLEAERRRSSSAALEAQERERARVARDLHDEVNQSLTGLLLRLEHFAPRRRPRSGDDLAETKALANQAMAELLSLSRQLRPTALDDLGLKAALAGLVDDVRKRGGIDAHFESTGEFGDVSTEVQLVVYRVAQEAMSNAIQHAESHVRAGQRWSATGSAASSPLADDGKGFTFDQAAGGLGIGGMRERALLVGGNLRVESRPGLGNDGPPDVPASVDAPAL